MQFTHEHSSSSASHAQHSLLSPLVKPSPPRKSFVTAGHYRRTPIISSRIESNRGIRKCILQENERHIVSIATHISRAANNVCEPFYFQILSDLLTDVQSLKKKERLCCNSRTHIICQRGFLARKFLFSVLECYITHYLVEISDDCINYKRVS